MAEADKAKDKTEEPEAEFPVHEEIERDDRQRIDQRIGGKQRDDWRARFRVEGVDRDRGRHQLVAAQQDEGDEEAAQMLTKAQTTTTTMPGRMTGSATSKKACSGEAPATIALSS